MVEEQIMNKFFAQRNLRAIKFEVLKLTEAAVRHELSLRGCSMPGDLVIVQDRLIRSIFRTDEKIAETLTWYDWDEEWLADFSEPEERGNPTFVHGKCTE